jgi:hypothetical protein
MHVNRETSLLLVPPLLAFSLTSSLLVYLAIADEARFLAYVPDDAFYYFKIAENVTRGYFFSFDTVTETNGFHPLWLFVIVPIISLFGKSLLPILLVEAFLAQAGNAIVAIGLRKIFNARMAIIFSILNSFNPLFSIRSGAYR